MLDVLVLRSALRAFSTLFGSLGIFFFYLSLYQPALSAYTLLFLGIASAIVCCAPKK